jgi:hypothetical protein
MDIPATNGVNGVDNLPPVKTRQMRPMRMGTPQLFRTCTNETTAPPPATSSGTVPRAAPAPPSRLPRLPRLPPTTAYPVGHRGPRRTSGACGEVETEHQGHRDVRASPVLSRVCRVFARQRCAHYRSRGAPSRGAPSREHTPTGTRMGVSSMGSRKTASSRRIGISYL